jgi:hypothetical protein
MKRAMMFEWRRMLRNKTFLFAFLGVCAFMLRSALYWYILYRKGVNRDTSVFYKWQGLGSGLAGDRFIFVLLPLFLALAYSWTCSYDRATGYINQIISRIGKKRYFAAKFFVSYISGGIIFAASLCVHFFFVSLFSPAYMPLPGDQMSAMDQFHFCSALFFQHPSVFTVIWSLTAFLWGGAISVTGVFFGMLTRNYYLTCLFPFLLFTGEQLIGSIIMRYFPFFINGVQISVIWTEMLFAGSLMTTVTSHVLMWIIGITSISTIGYCICGWQYESL